VAPLKAKTGMTHFDRDTQPKILKKQFSSVLNKGEDISTISDMGPNPHEPVGHITITESGVQTMLAGLNPHKAPGPDQLKEAATELTSVFTLFP